MRVVVEGVGAQSLSVACQKRVHARSASGPDGQPFLDDTLAMNQKWCGNMEAGMDPICAARGEAKDNVVSAEFLDRYFFFTDVRGSFQPALSLLLMLLRTH